MIVADTIKSVLQQDYPNIEYIIVDGMSTDNTLSVIKRETADRHNDIKLVSEPDSGIYDALNKAIRMAAGDIIGLCHSDDVLFASNTISRVVECCERTDCDLLYADGLFVDADNSHRVVRRWIGGHYSKWKVRHGWLPLHTTCYIKREFMQKHGLYDTQYRIVADTDLLLRYLLMPEIKVAYLHEYVTRMRMGGVSTDASQRRKMWREDVKAYANHGFAFPTIKKVEKVMWKIPQFIMAKVK